MLKQRETEIKTYKIGRGSHCDIVLRDTSVSRDHAEISFLPNNRGIVISDLKSFNGTFVIVDNEPVRIEQQHIRTSDEIQFGSVIKAVREIITEIEQLDGPLEDSDLDVNDNPDTADRDAIELPEGDLRFDESGSLVQRKRNSRDDE